MRQPRPIDLRRERALIWMWCADLFVQLLFIAAAILTGSLTILGEVLRLTLVGVLDLTTILFLRALHRDRLARHRVAIGKIEIVLQFVIGCALLLSALWVGSRALASLHGEGASIPPALVAVAAITNATNVLVNVLTWYALRSADGADASPIYRVQVVVRFYAVVISLIVQATLTAAVLTHDGWFGTLFDALGAAFTALIMTWRGLVMTRTALPDLLDHPIAPATCAEIGRLLSGTGRLADGVALARTRQGGNLPQVELAIAPLPGETTEALRRRAARLSDMLVERFGPARVAFALADPAGPPPDRVPSR